MEAALVGDHHFRRVVTHRRLSRVEGRVSWAAGFEASTGAIAARCPSPVRVHLAPRTGGIRRCAGTTLHRAPQERRAVAMRHSRARDSALDRARVFIWSGRRSCRAAGSRLWDNCEREQSMSRWIQAVAMVLAIGCGQGTKGTSGSIEQHADAPPGTRDDFPDSPPNTPPPAATCGDQNGGGDQHVDFEGMRAAKVAEKPTVEARQAELLAARYDLSDQPAPGVVMSRGKPVQQGGARAVAGAQLVRARGDEPRGNQGSRPVPVRFLPAAASEAAGGRHALSALD